jgi:hypothetical protein
VEDRDRGLTDEGHARRRFLKQAGAAAWGAPLIVTMMSRTAHANHSPGHCGTLNVSPNPNLPQPLAFCQVEYPCGSSEQCAPDPNTPFVSGQPCICQPA